MKVTLRDALNIAEGLREYGQCKKQEDGRISYRLAKMRRDIERELKDFTDVRKELVERLQTSKDEKGQPVVEAGTPQHEELAKEIERLLGEQTVLYWIEIDYDKFNPKNKLGLSEDFFYLTFPMWTDPDAKQEEPKEEP